MMMRVISRMISSVWIPSRPMRNTKATITGSGLFSWTGPAKGFPVIERNRYRNNFLAV
jgi:hypothetical protein